jgi:hypothetical protein
VSIAGRLVSDPGEKEEVKVETEMVWCVLTPGLLLA